MKKYILNRINGINRAYIAIFALVVFILSFVVSNIYYTLQKKELLQAGKSTVCYVYKYGASGKTSIKRAKYYFFVGSTRYDNEWEIEADDLIPLNKFYKVYYSHADPAKNYSNFLSEIPSDSVFLYFPAGENPFEKEIRNKAK